MLTVHGIGLIFGEEVSFRLEINYVKSFFNFGARGFQNSVFCLFTGLKLKIFKNSYNRNNFYGYNTHFSFYDIVHFRARFSY